MSYAVAQRYAQALFDAAQERSRLDNVHRDLGKIAKLLEQSADLKHFLIDPIIPSLKSQAVIKDVFDGKIDELTYKFVLFLQAKRRLPQLLPICAAFNDLFDEAKHILRAKWTSSTDLSTHDTRILSDYLKEKFDNKEIIPEPKVDPRIGGGIKIQVKDTIYDYTIAAQLRRFQQSVMRT